jgi:hypothetical protein
MADDKKIKSPAVQPRAEELTLVSDFPDQWRGNVKNEIIGMVNSNSKTKLPKGTLIWAPATEDFFAVAETDIKPKSKIKLVRNFGNFLAEMQAFKPGTVQRVNLITHAVGGLISFSGVCPTDGGVAFNNVDVTDPVNSPGMDSNFIDVLNGIFVPQGVDPNLGKSMRDDIRSRFRPDGEFILYGCGGASGTGVDLFIQLSKCFNIRVSGFVEHIEIQPTFDQARNVILSRNETRYENKPVPARSGPFVPGFKYLKPDSPPVPKPNVPAP